MPNALINSTWLLFLLILVIAIYTDLHKRKISNLLILFGLVSSLVVQLFSPQGFGFTQWGVGVLVGFICFFPLYFLRAMAAGDVKLMMVVGGFVGFPLVITAAIYSYAAGGILAFLIVLGKGQFRQLIHNLRVMITPIYIKMTSGVDVGDGLIRKANLEQASIGRMPYALAIAAGTLLALYFESAKI